MRLPEFVEQHLEPLVAASVKRRLGYFGSKGGAGVERPREVQATEVYGWACARLVARLRTLWEQGGRSDTGAPVIGNLARYVDAAVANGCRDYRSRHSAWRSLHLRTEQVLRRSHELTSWVLGDGETAAGLAAWEHRGSNPVRCETWFASREKLLRLAPWGDVHSVPFPELVVGVVRRLGGPVRLEDLLALLAALLEIQDPLIETASSHGEGEDPLEGVADPYTDVEATVLDREFLGRVWKEMIGLPYRWRAALLLGSGELASLLYLTRTAGLSQLAAALRMAPEELADLWNGLPLSEDVLADRLGITAGSVRNYRSWALKRLRNANYD